MAPSNKSQAESLPRIQRLEAEATKALGPLTPFQPHADYESIWEYTP